MSLGAAYLALLLVAVLLRFLYVCPFLRKRGRRHRQQQRPIVSKRSKGVPAPTAIVMGSGGHSHEMLRLVEALPRHYRPIYYIIGHSDTLSTAKISSFEAQQGRPNGNYFLERIHRPREVQQSLLSFGFLMDFTWSCIDALRWILNARPLPQLVLCNGPALCVPVILAVYLAKMLGKPVLVVYVESFARVSSLSLSGRIAYLLADRLVVQWPDLAVQYPRADYIGPLL